MGITKNVNVKTLMKNCMMMCKLTELSYLCNRLSSGGGYVVVMKSRIRLGWVIFRECLDLLCRKKFPLKIK